MSAVHEFTEWSLAGPDGLRNAPANLVASDPRLFRHRGRRWQFADVTITDSAMSPIRVGLSPNHDAQNDFVTVTFVRSGTFDLHDGDRTLRFEAGSAGYMQGVTSIVAEGVTATRSASVTMRKDRLAAHGVVVPSRIGAFAPSSRLRGPSLSFVLALMNEITTVERSSLEPTAAVLTQLMTGLFLEDAGYSMDSVQLSAGLRARAIALIEQNAANPDYSPAMLARQLNVSLRHLQRSFSDTGKGPADAIRAARLKMALDVFRSTAHRPASVTEIATRSGFSSPKELRYALKSHSGMTPRDFLASRVTG